MRRAVLLLAVAVSGLALAAHLWFWYAPRERPGAPSSGAAAALFTGSKLPYRLWIPYPHQTLARLRRDVPAGVGAALRLFGVKTPRLQRFGPFDVPPSSAIAVASDARGDRWTVAAQVYPAIAAIARAAGSLAGNPWLSGGEVESGGRRLRIGWASGGVWWVTSEDPAEILALLGRPAESPGLPAGLAWLRSAKSLGPLPPGDYRLSGPAATPKLVFRSPGGVETEVLDLAGDGSRLEIRLPAAPPGD
jgi:hypothetical protein